MKRTQKSAVLCAIGAAWSAGCGAGWSMAVPPDVAASSEELPIKGRSSWTGALVDESFDLGGYHVSDVDRKWNSTRSSSLFGFEQSRTQGGFAFELSAQGAKLRGECITEQLAQSKDLGGGASFGASAARLGCSCGDGSRQGTLLLEASGMGQYGGSMKGADYAYQVSSVTERENGRAPSRDPLGYRVDGDRPIGAVGVVKPGRVWLNKSLPEEQRRELACLFAGLLIYQPPADR